MQKQITHRGWAENIPEENTRKAFARSEEASDVDGVGFDVRWSNERAEPVVCHYAWQEKEAESLNDVLAFLASAQTMDVMLIELKEYYPFLWAEIKKLLEYYHLVDKTIIFASPRIAKKFPWETRERMQLGVISIYPWRIHHYAKLKPASILFGYDKLIWKQILFRIFWRDAFIRRLCRVYPDIKFILGIAQNKKHIVHINSLDGLYGYTVDKR